MGTDRLPHRDETEPKPTWRSSKVLQLGVLVAILVYVPMAIWPWISALIEPQELFWVKMIASPTNAAVLAALIWLWRRMRPARDLWPFVYPILFGGAGFLYGMMLTGLGMIAAGGGHGTSVLLGLFSSPLGLVSRLATLILTPVLWAIAGGLAAFAWHKRARRCLVSLLLVHYLTAVILLTMTNFGDWSYVNRVWMTDKWIFINSLTIYLLGQGTLTWQIVRQECRAPTPPRSLQFSLRGMLTVITICGVLLAIAVPTDVLKYALHGMRVYQLYIDKN